LNTRRLTGLGVLGLSLAFALGQSREARAQHTPDPYNIVGEYNRQYEPYLYATQPSAGDMVSNEDRVGLNSGLRNANQFRDLADDPSEGALGDRANSGRSTGGIGVPYYRAYRQYDEQLNRVYQPNKETDQLFRDSQRRRDESFFQTQRDLRKEKDPKKRAQLLRENTLESLRSARDVSTGRKLIDRERSNARERGARDAAAADADDMDAGRSAAPARRNTAPERPGTAAARSGGRDARPGATTRSFDPDADLSTDFNPGTVTRPARPGTRADAPGSTPR